MKYKRRKFVIRVSDKWRGESGVALFYFIQRGHYVQFGVDMCTINFCWYNQNKYPPKNYPSPTLRKQYNSSKIQKCWLCCVKTFQLELVYLLHMVLLFVKVAFSTRAEWTKQFCKFWNRVWKLPQDLSWHSVRKYTQMLVYYKTKTSQLLLYSSTKRLWNELK